MNVLPQDKDRKTSFVSVGGSHLPRQPSRLVSQQEIMNIKCSEVKIKRFHSKKVHFHFGENVLSCVSSALFGKHTELWCFGYKRPQVRTFHILLIIFSH